MTDRSAAELELDAELARARVADTAESIRSKITPGQLIDEFSGLFSGGDGVSALTTLKGQVSQNPLAISLVGAGLAWLMLGNAGGTAQASGGETRPSRARVTEPGGRDFSFDNGAPPLSYEGDDDKSIGDRVSEAGDTVKSLAGSAVGAVKNAVSSTTDGLQATTRDAASKASAMLDSGTMKNARDMITQEPLVLAALGLAVGTAIGAMLPHTAIEDEQLGDISGQLRDKAKDILDKGVAGAKDVAADAYQSIKDAADAQEDGGSLVEKVGDVLKTAATETEAAVRERLPDPS